MSIIFSGMTDSNLLNINETIPSIFDIRYDMNNAKNVEAKVKFIRKRLSELERKVDVAFYADLERHGEKFCQSTAEYIRSRLKKDYTAINCWIIEHR